MWQHGPAAVALKAATQARTEDDGARQSHHTSNRVDHGGTSEIVEARSHPRQEIARAAHGGEESIRPPGPVPDDRVDEARDGETVNQVTHKARSANHRARRNRGACVCERKLE